jgi:hypothetical protein
MIALDLTQILGQPCDFQVPPATGKNGAACVRLSKQGLVFLIKYQLKSCCGAGHPLSATLNVPGMRAN